MRVHAFSTGTVTVRTRQREGAGPGPVRALRTMADRTWTEPLPILVFAIEHPEGVVLVDTGETAAASGPGHFPAWHPYYRLAVRFDVGPQDELGPQLRAVGIEPDDVRRVVLTHLHTDHSGGLRHVPRSEVVVSRAELDAASGRRGRLNGYLNDKWPVTFAPTTVDFADGPFGPFERSHTLTDAGDVRLVPTPGHTPGHLSVVLDLPEARIVFAGDASYTEELMRRGVPDGITTDVATSRDSLDRLRRLVDERPSAYLPTHDAGSPDRLRAALDGS